MDRSEGKTRKVT